MNITNNVIKEQERQGIEIEGKEIDQSTFEKHTLMLNEFLAYVTRSQVTQTPQFISKQSGIERDEVERRAERKVKALNYCTTWMALCLVSREQNLEMNSIIDSLSAS